MSSEREGGAAMQQRTWRLWMGMVEQSARADALQAQLDRTLASRSWRVTAPLRALLRLLGVGSSGHRPALQAAPLFKAAVPCLQETLATAARDGVAPEWMPSAAGPAPQSRLFVDVTELALEDLGAGVQRVTRRVLAAMLALPTPALAVEPVRLSSDRGYVLARQFVASSIGLPVGSLGEDVGFVAGAGDVLLALDFHREHADAVGAAAAGLRASGVVTCFVVHDALPATNPDWFPAGVADDYGRWLAMVSRTADSLLCISDATRKAVLEQLDARGLSRPVAGAFVFPMGSDPSPAIGAAPLPAKAPSSTRVLMVATLEPRKGHDQALAAMELLWQHSHDFELVLVGRAGWMTEGLAARLRGHAEAGCRLHWFEQLDDRALLGLYATSDVLLHPSRGEGYGLPIAEAGRSGCPLLLRDLPVFVEIAGDSADYFHADTANELAAALLSWRDAPGARARPDRHRWPLWSDSAEALMGLCHHLVQTREVVPSPGSRP
jgi:glycosyltransferase involved in cell wall biosynthesis